jgi:hypothetical protein
MEDEWEVWCEDGGGSGEYELTCEHPNCREVVTAEDEYIREDKNIPNGWGDCGELLCKAHAVGRTKVNLA